MKAPARRAFSYARFSSTAQADGASLARQLEATKRYCDRNGLVLDERTFSDLGVSGFTGSNLAGELGQFIELVKSGRIPKGSTLLVENVDRLSRLPPSEANAIITGIVKAGIDVVTTSPEAVYTSANIDKLATWLPLQIASCLAHEESVKRGDRIRDAWNRKRAALTTPADRKLSRKCPFWLRVSPDGKSFIVKEREAALVRLMFQMSINGAGAPTICGELHKRRPEGISGKGWQSGNLRKLLRSRQVVGEYQPHVGTTARKGSKATRQPVGAPIANFFPTIVSEADFLKVQTLLDSRYCGGGPTRGTPNLFNSLMFDAADGERLQTCFGRDKWKMLVSAAALNKRTPEFRCFPLRVMEEAILSALSALKAADVVGTGPTPDSELETWSARLTAINHKIDKAKQRAATADDPEPYFELIDQHAAERKVIIAELEKAKQSAASPVGDTLGEVRSLVTLLNDATGDERDDLRTRIRAALARLIVRFDTTILRHGRHERFATVLARFRGDGAHRLFSIHWDGKSRQWTCRSERASDIAIVTRTPDDAEADPVHMQRLRTFITVEESADSFTEGWGDIPKWSRGTIEKGK